MEKGIVQQVREALLNNDAIKELMKNGIAQQHFIFNAEYRRLYELELMRHFALARTKKALENVFDYTWVFEKPNCFDIFFARVYAVWAASSNLSDSVKNTIVPTDEKLINELLTKGKFYNCLKSLEHGLFTGRNYETIESISMSAFELNETWHIDNMFYDKQKAIYHAIAFAFDLVSSNHEPLRTIAKKINASYDIMLRAQDFAHELIRQNIEFEKFIN